MLPAQPPLPTARNLPFQFSAGIHNSISMLESGDGFNVNATLQCAGNVAACPRPPPACCPAATNSAEVIVACGVERDFKPSQDGCWNIAAATTRPSTEVITPPMKELFSEVLRQSHARPGIRRNSLPDSSSLHANS